MKHKDKETLLKDKISGLRGHNKNLGFLGETIACEFLVKHGFSVIERNFLRKCGEIDIIAQKQGIFYFCEVKTVSQVTSSGKAANLSHLPEENVDRRKLSRMYRTIELYLSSRPPRFVMDDVPFEIRVITVVLNAKTRRARVAMIECL